jgi:hypothetical protein
MFNGLKPDIRIAPIRAKNADHYDVKFWTASFFGDNFTKTEASSDSIITFPFIENYLGEEIITIDCQFLENGSVA